jgi:hypothetical protein
MCDAPDSETLCVMGETTSSRRWRFAVMCGAAVLVVSAAAPAQAATPGELLSRYTPTLKYEAGQSADGYRADSPAEMTNNYRATGPPFDCSGVGEGYSNTLKHTPVDPDPNAGGPPEILAVSDPRSSCPDLKLSFLGPHYRGGGEASIADFLDEHNDTYAEDAARMHANPRFGNRVYGRAIRSGGRLWLQYWFFYYYNPQSEFGIGSHEGDWEMIELGLRDNGVPFRASYAQHNGHEVCPWGDVLKNGTSPLVFVADGSHASYYSSGVEGRGELPDDNHLGDGPVAGPNVSDPGARLTLVDISRPGPRWLRWPGRWGASDASPLGPKFQDAWTSPKGIAQSSTSGHSCLRPT